MSKARPVCYIIAGPNGAGKTTFALEFLPAAGCKRFINADLIAAGIAPLAPETMQFSAGRLFIDELRQHINNRKSFGFETTLSGRAYLRLIRQLQESGWQVKLYYLWLPSVEFSILRVEERVRHGGHSIPEDDIRRRYPKSIRNLIDLYRHSVDQTICLDNSGRESVTIFQQQGNEITIYDKQTYKQLMGDHHE